MFQSVFDTPATLFPSDPTCVLILVTILSFLNYLLFFFFKSSNSEHLGLELNTNQIKQNNR